jgi:tetratricopeptide (TPR) repeat protein
VVIGNPLGLEGSISEGIISAIRTDQGLIQITAPVSPGSSGSPVMTDDGKVMGVAALQSEHGQNLNFAIPVQIVNAAIAGINQKNPASLASSATEGTTLNLAPEVVQARAFIDSHNDVDAVTLIRDYLEKTPTDVEGWVTYAEALGGMQRWEAAADAAQKAVDLDPKSLDRWRVLTYCVAMFNGETKNGNPIASARLKEVAQHDLAMGDDSNLAYYALIQAAETEGEKEKAAQLRQQYEKLKESGELADYLFGKEQRYFGKQVMFPAEQVAKSLGLEVADKTLFLDLSGQGHFFSLAIEGSLVLVDGIKLEVGSLPVRYKHQCYYLDSDVVEGVIEGVLNPKKIRVFFGTPSPPEFRIQNIWLEALLELQEPETNAATIKLMDAALKLDPSLFKNEVESDSKQGIVIDIQCKQNIDLTEGCQITTKLGDQIQFQLKPDQTATALVLVSTLAEGERAKLANVFQILFARTIAANFLKADVTASTAFESSSPPIKNPSLFIRIVLPTKNTDEDCEMIARSLSQAATLLNSELSK